MSLRENLLTVEAPGLLDKSSGANDIKGCSIAISGVCLSVIDWTAETFSFEISSETLRRTTLGKLRQGDMVNLEPALRMGDPLDGHLVLGHVDAVSSIEQRVEEGQTTRLQIATPNELLPLIAEKGSIAVDGVSLTVGEITDSWFSVYLIVITKDETTLGAVPAGQYVNLEVDCIARYVERQLYVRSS